MSVARPAPYVAPPLLAVGGLSTGFTVLSVLEILLQAVLLGLLVFGLVSPDLVGTSATLIAICTSAYLIISLVGRILGSVVLLRQQINLARLGIEGMRLAPFAVAIFWVPLFVRGVWVLPYVLFPELVGVQAVWVLAAIVAVLTALPLHELWRASAPDQIEHWRYVPLGGPVVGWTVATVVDSMIPLIQPFAIWASVVFVRRLDQRVQDKRVVVGELRLLAARRAATESLPTAESAP